MKLVYVSSGCIFPSECGKWEAKIELCGPFWLWPEVFSYWVAVSEAVFVSIPVSGAWNNVGIPGHAQCKLRF